MTTRHRQDGTKNRNGRGHEPTNADGAGNGRIRDVLDQPLPHDLDAEQAVLGSMLLDNATINEVLALLPDASYMYRQAHQRVYDAIRDLFVAGGAVDPLLLRSELQLRGQLGAPGLEELTTEYIGDILELTPTAANARYYARIVRDKWLARRRVLLGMRLVCAGNDPAGCADEADAIADEFAALGETASGAREPARATIRVLIDDYPRLHPPVIDGLLRERETLNIISVSKIGKSWLLYSLLLAIATGTQWLGRFATLRGRVLLTDNELHRPTIAHRIRTVAEALELPPDDWLDSIDVWPIRGAGLDIDAIADHLERASERFALVAIDAKYRALPASATENDNAAETRLYNTLDQLAETIGCAVALVHHTSKGGQGDKRVTDVGAGAGAQSRAADSHLVLREHEEPDTVVLEAAVRSFRPVQPIVLRWMYPLWVAADDMDPAALRGRRSRTEERQAARDQTGADAVLGALRAGPASVRVLRRRTGLSAARCERLLDRLESDRRITAETVRLRGNDCRMYHVVDDGSTT